MWTLHRLGLKGAFRRPDPVEYDDNEEMSRPRVDVKDVTRGVTPFKTKIASTGVSKAGPPWEFSDDELERFPSLRQRNFWCIQRHQARGTNRCWF